MHDDHDHHDHKHDDQDHHNKHKSAPKPKKSAGHNHAHGHHGHAHGHGNVAGNLKVALFLNLGFAILEIIGGLWTGSVAILSDAIHDLGDAMSLGVAYVMERMATRGSNQKFSYGYRRVSLLSALITGAFLLVASCFVLARAIPRLMNPEMPKLDGMLGFAIVGIAVNGYAAWRLMRGTTMNERLVSWHLIEDVLGWVTVLIGTIAMMIWDAPIIDPIMSILFSLFIFRGVLRNVSSTVRLFLQATPDDVDLGELRREIAKVAGVRSTHDAHLWSLDGESHVLTIHVVVAETATLQDMESIKTQVRTLAAKQGRLHVTIEIESESAECAAATCDGVSHLAATT